MKPEENITIENIDHLGLVAGIIDEIGLVEQIYFNSFKTLRNEGLRLLLLK